MPVVAFILGNVVGGLIGIGFMCCWQLDRKDKQKGNNY